VYNSNYYGTCKEEYHATAKSGKSCIFDVDINGCLSLKKTGLPCKLIFISPGQKNPMQVLEQRLRGRGSETEQSIHRRLERAKEDLKYLDVPGIFDIVIEKEEHNTAYYRLKEFLRSVLLI